MKLITMILMMAATSAFAVSGSTSLKDPATRATETAYDAEIEPPSPEELRQDMASMRQGQDSGRAPASVTEDYKLPQ